MGIGKTINTKKDYVDNFGILAKRTIQLLCFAFLSGYGIIRPKSPATGKKRITEIIVISERIIDTGLDQIPPSAADPR